MLLIITCDGCVVLTYVFRIQLIHNKSPHPTRAGAEYGRFLAICGVLDATVQNLHVWYALKQHLDFNVGEFKSVLFTDNFQPNVQMIIKLFGTN